MTAPAGMLSYPKHLLRQVLAETAAIQTWFGGSPLTKIHYSLLQADDVRSLMPFAVIEWAQFRLNMLTAGASNGLWPENPRMRLYFMDIDRAEPVVQQATVDPAKILEGDILFENNVGAVLRDLADLAAVNDRLATSSVDLEIPTTRNPVKNWASSGPYIWTTFLIGYN